MGDGFQSQWHFYCSLHMSRELSRPPRCCHFQHPVVVQRLHLKHVLRFGSAAYLLLKMPSTLTSGCSSGFRPLQDSGQPNHAFISLAQQQCHESRLQGCMQAEHDIKLGPFLPNRAATAFNGCMMALFAIQNRGRWVPEPMAFLLLSAHVA